MSKFSTKARRGFLVGVSQSDLSALLATSGPVEGEDDRMIDSPQWWPEDGKLAFKRPWSMADPQSRDRKHHLPISDGDEELGLMLYDTDYEGGQRRMYLANKFQPISSETPFVDYESTEAVLEAGWAVD